MKARPKGDCGGAGQRSAGRREGPRSAEQSERIANLFDALAAGSGQQDRGHQHARASTSASAGQPSPRQERNDSPDALELVHEGVLGGGRGGVLAAHADGEAAGACRQRQPSRIRGQGGRARVGRRQKAGPLPFCKSRGGHRRCNGDRMGESELMASRAGQASVGRHIGSPFSVCSHCMQAMAAPAGEGQCDSEHLQGAVGAGAWRAGARCGSRVAVMASRLVTPKGDRPISPWCGSGATPGQSEQHSPSGTVDMAAERVARTAVADAVRTARASMAVALGVESVLLGAARQFCDRQSPLFALGSPITHRGARRADTSPFTLPCAAGGAARQPMPGRVRREL